MVFLRPVIVRDQATSTQIANTRYDYLRQQQYGSTTDNRLIKDQNVPVMPPKPLGPSEGGGAPAQNLLDWSNTTRGPGPSTTLPQNPDAGPAPQPMQSAPQSTMPPQSYPLPANGATNAMPGNAATNTLPGNAATNGQQGVRP
jgi:general secretion pathway protein D